MCLEYSSGPDAWNNNYQYFAYNPTFVGLGKEMKKRELKKHIESAEMLPQAAHTLAIGSFTKFIDKFPSVQQIKPERWDFILTIAGIFVGVTKLYQDAHIPENEKTIIIEAVTKASIQIYPDAVEASDDCRTFVDRTYDALAKLASYQDNPQFIFSDSLGTWIVWNIFERQTEEDDEESRQLMRVIGGYIVHSFISWWEQ